MTNMRYARSHRWIPKKYMFVFLLAWTTLIILHVNFMYHYSKSIPFVKESTGLWVNFFQRRPIRRGVQWQKFKKGLQVETSSHIENIFTLAHNNIKKEMSILHFDHVHIINIICLIIINIIMTIFNISTLIIRAARDSGAKGDCRRLQRGCPLSIFNMPLFNSPWFQ